MWRIATINTVITYRSKHLHRYICRSRILLSSDRFNSLLLTWFGRSGALCRWPGAREQGWGSAPPTARESLRWCSDRWTRCGEEGGGCWSFLRIWRNTSSPGKFKLQPHEVKEYLHFWFLLDSFEYNMCGITFRFHYSNTKMSQFKPGICESRWFERTPCCCQTRPSQWCPGRSATVQENKLGQIQTRYYRYKSRRAGGGLQLPWRRRDTWPRGRSLESSSAFSLLLPLW